MPRPPDRSLAITTQTLEALLAPRLAAEADDFRERVRTVTAEYSQRGLARSSSIIEACRREGRESFRRRSELIQTTALRVASGARPKDREAILSFCTGKLGEEADRIEGACASLFRSWWRSPVAFLQQEQQLALNQLRAELELAAGEASKAQRKWLEIKQSIGPFVIDIPALFDRISRLVRKIRGVS